MVFKNKTAIVTGATRGVGKEIAKSLAIEGCEVLLIGRDKKGLEDTASEIESNGGNIQRFRVDLEKASEVENFLKNRVCDILVNCAGIFPMQTICDTTLEEYDKCFTINVKAPFMFCRSLAPQMKENKWGRIVNITSSSAYGGGADTGVYCASKHALLGLTRSLYNELKPHNVRVYSVAPGSIQTDMGASDKRQNFSTFLRAEEVAEYVTYIMKFDKEMIPEEIRLSRMVIE